MTDRIQQIIDEIRFKTQALHSQLNEEREKNAALHAELSSVSEELNSVKASELANGQKIAELESIIESSKSQVVETSHSSGRSNEEIDELVKEIEYCISQLKK